MKVVKVSDISIGDGYPIVLIAGPCVIEDEDECFNTAVRLKEITSSLNTPFIFKSSYDKANRTSCDSFRGPGIDKGLEVLQKIKEEVKVPILSDVHNIEEIEPAAKVLDVLQIPAFLCRQTDFVMEVGRTGKPVNIKKGQFLAPWDIKWVIEKIEKTGNKKILLTERGVSFGYNNLVADMRSLPIMRNFGYPVVFDATHSVQLPGGAGASSSGQREFVPYLSRAAVAVGIDALFLEIHECPQKARCDGENMLEIKELPTLLKQVKEIDNILKGGI